MGAIKNLAEKGGTEFAQQSSNFAFKIFGPLTKEHLKIQITLALVKTEQQQWKSKHFRPSHFAFSKGIRFKVSRHALTRSAIKSACSHSSEWSAGAKPSTRDEKCLFYFLCTCIRLVEVNRKAPQLNFWKIEIVFQWAQNYIFDAIIPVAHYNYATSCLKKERSQIRKWRCAFVIVHNMHCVPYWIRNSCAKKENIVLVVTHG